MATGATKIHYVLQSRKKFYSMKYVFRLQVSLAPIHTKALPDKESIAVTKNHCNCHESMAVTIPVTRTIEQDLLQLVWQLLWWQLPWHNARSRALEHMSCHLIALTHNMHQRSLTSVHRWPLYHPMTSLQVLFSTCKVKPSGDLSHWC